ncbi:LytR/AlgR family response regulator transcription factor [Emticicia sp. 17c]|uniref:LytR/AlgR family response regulator transcription factor n=1 Tax=Emticicia sp. 17c TaxID=3127704 RepID=UPI00301B8C14
MNNSLLIHFGRHKVDPKTILLLKADTNYTQIYLEDGSSFLSSITLGTLARRLPEVSFFRPNRSVLINLDYMDDSENDKALIRMKNNEVFKVSRRRTKHFYTIRNRRNKDLSW